MHEGGKNEKRENEGLRRKMKGTKAEEENESFRGETKGAGSAQGENRMHEGFLLKKYEWGQ